jgi:hypothetical protein
VIRGTRRSVPSGVGDEADRADVRRLGQGRIVGDIARGLDAAGIARDRAAQLAVAHGFGRSRARSKSNAWAGTTGPWRASKARRVSPGPPRLGQQDVERDPARFVTAEQDLDQVGQALARPGPRADAGQAGLVDVDHQDARLRRVADLDAQEGVAHPFVGDEGEARRRRPLHPGGQQHCRDGDQPADRRARAQDRYRRGSGLWGEVCHAGTGR